MPRILRNLRVREISAVDRGAGEGVKISLTKRALPPDVEAYLKREFSQEERDRAADSGAAMPDGSFPIKDKSDLRNAIQAIGRAKNPAKAKAHIKARARALGAEDMLPDTWKRAEPSDLIDFTEWAKRLAAEPVLAKASIDFDGAVEHLQAAQGAGVLMGSLHEAICALDCSIRSILDDEDVADKGAAITESFGQFREHLDDLQKNGAAHDGDEDDDDEKGADEPDADDLEGKEKAMTKFSPEQEKQVADMIAKAVEATNAKAAETIAALQTDLAVAKMTEVELGFYKGLSDEADKRKFVGMSRDERDDHIAKARRRSEDDPVIKAMKVENEELKKRLQKMEDDRDIEVCKRDARELGMTQADAGEVLMKARRGDREAIKKLEEYTAQLKKERDEIARTGKVFQEFGKGGGPGGGGSAASGNGSGAYDQLVAKAEELRKAKPDLTPAQAFVKVMEDSANRDLVAQEAQERMAKITR